MLEMYGQQSVESHFQNNEGGQILDRAIAGMLEELQPNLFEEELARKVDFGHTFSYGLETDHEADLFHGEAVLLDIMLSVVIAKSRNLLTEEDTGRIFELIQKLGISLDIALLEPELLWQSLEERTYHRNGLQRVPMPHGIGNCVFINDINANEIEENIKLLEEWMVVKHGNA